MKLHAKWALCLLSLGKNESAVSWITPDIPLPGYKTRIQGQLGIYDVRNLKYLTPADKVETRHANLVNDAGFFDPSSWLNATSWSYFNSKVIPNGVEIEIDKTKDEKLTLDNDDIKKLLNMIIMAVKGGIADEVKNDGDATPIDTKPIVKLSNDGSKTYIIDIHRSTYSSIGIVGSSLRTTQEYYYFVLTVCENKGMFVDSNGVFDKDKEIAKLITSVINPSIYDDKFADFKTLAGAIGWGHKIEEVEKSGNSNSTKKSKIDELTRAIFGQYIIARDAFDIDFSKTETETLLNIPNTKRLIERSLDELLFPIPIKSPYKPSGGGSEESDMKQKTGSASFVGISAAGAILGTVIGGPAGAVMFGGAVALGSLVYGEYYMIAKFLEKPSYKKRIHTNYTLPGILTDEEYIEVDMKPLQDNLFKLISSNAKDATFSIIKDQADQGYTYRITYHWNGLYYTAMPTYVCNAPDKDYENALSQHPAGNAAPKP